MTNTPAIIKEYLFHLLAQSLRILHYSEGCNSSKLPTLNPHLNPSTGLLVQLQAELRRLYEEETKGNILKVVWDTLRYQCGQKYIIFKIYSIFLNFLIVPYLTIKFIILQEFLYGKKCYSLSGLHANDLQFSR